LKRARVHSIFAGKRALLIAALIVRSRARAALVHGAEEEAVPHVLGVARKVVRNLTEMG